MGAYSVLEYKTLLHGETEGCIPEALARRLAKVARQSSFAGLGEGGVLEDQRHGLRARGVVGVVAAEGGSLEILPKIDVDAPEDSDAAKGKIRERLVHMLAVARDLKIDTGRISPLGWQRETLLEILIRLFCETLTDAVRRGMPRRYLTHEDDLAALRGTLDVTRQFTRHAANPARLACRFDDLSPDIALNRIMKAALLHLSRMSQSAANQQRLRELAFLYSDVRSVPSRALPWDAVILDRTNEPWQEAFGLAKLFLKGRYQTTSAGAEQGTSLLFEMNMLFEEYVGRLVVRAMAGSGRSVSLQGGRAYCLTSLDDGRQLFQTKPDILIRESGRVVHVIDTKWKRISSRIEDRKQGVSQADIYQMMAYERLYDAPRLTLMYPHHAGLSVEEGPQARYQIQGTRSMLTLASFDVAKQENGVGRLRRISEAWQ